MPDACALSILYRNALVDAYIVHHGAMTYRAIPS